MTNIRRFVTVNELKEHLISLRSNGPVGFVPTMGALHEGHLSLLDRAIEECSTVVLSIFVNPKQFNNKADLEKYPRDLSRDIEQLGHRDVIVFTPEYSDVYPSDFEPARVDIGNLGNVMEGEFRPGHFDGVVTVVSRLFDIVMPDKAYFGEKDYQQLAIIRKMCELQNRDLEIVPCAIMREHSGLAMSSRNMLLKSDELEFATGIYKILERSASQVNLMLPMELANTMIKQFNEEGFDLEYLRIAHPDTLQPLTNEWVDGARVFVACFVGQVRLIDNIALN